MLAHEMRRYLRKPAFGRLKCDDCGRVVTWKALADGRAVSEWIDDMGGGYTLCACEHCKAAPQPTEG